MKRETSKTQSPRREKPLVLRILTGKLFLIAAFSIVFYTMAGFFLLPYLLKSQLTEYVAEDLSRTIRIEKIRVNPYVMTLEISNVELKEADGGRILAFDQLSMDFELKSLFLWAWTFSDISLAGLVLQVDVAPDKTINLARLVQDV